MSINGISSQNAYPQSASLSGLPGNSTNSTFAAALETFKTTVQASQQQVASQSGTSSSEASGTTLSQQLQALESATLSKYQNGNNFKFDVSDGAGDAGASSTDASTTKSTATGDQLSGSFTSDALIAVGTITPDGKLDPFSSAQVQSEMAMVANMGQISFADSLQNYLALAQAGSPTGEISASSYSDQQRFVGDNGLVSVAYNTSFALQPAGGTTESVPSPGSTLSTTA